MDEDIFDTNDEDRCICCGYGTSHANQGRCPTCLEDFELLLMGVAAIAGKWANADLGDVLDLAKEYWQENRDRKKG